MPPAAPRAIATVCSSSTRPCSLASLVAVDWQIALGGEAATIEELEKLGLIFTGIDVIGDYITEINVTSPTGIREVKRFGGADIAALIWDAIEKRVAA